MPFDERPLAILGAGFRRETFVVSADGRHVAMAAAPPPPPGVMYPWDKIEDVLPRMLEPQAGECCWIDGEPGPTFQKIEHIVFSTDGRHVAYIALAANGSFVVHDGIVQTTYPSIVLDSLAFSADGDHLAYLADAEDGTRAIVFDGQERDRSASVEQLTLAPRGGRCAYFTSDDGRWHAAVDGTRGPAFDENGVIAFSLDGRHVAYSARIDGMVYVVADAVFGPPFTGVGMHWFNVDGTRLAYAAQLGDQQAVIVNGQAETAFPLVADSTLTFSPDGRRLAYLASDRVAQFMVVDGTPGPRFDGALQPQFSDDSRRLAYIATRGSKMCVVIDGAAGPEFDGVGDGTFRFSASSERFCYDAEISGKRHAVRDHEPGPGYDAIGKGTPVLSADGGRMAYTASREGRWFVVVDGREEAERWDGIVAGSLKFSPDGHQVVYAAGVGADQYLFVDDQRFGPYAGLVGAIVFDADQSLHALVLRDHYIVHARFAR
ncbi:MAG TPA: hypothetical protein VHV77_16490 [Pirellulales bacterium]|nr:hypothetical protein [Pirellulales bacterium]